MRILVYTWYPPIEKIQIGGTQHVMRDLLLALADAGISLTVLCPTGDRDALLPDSVNLRILPILESGYGRQVLPYQIADDLARIAREADRCDVVWSIGRPFPLNVPQPVVLRLDNFSYEGEVASFFHLSWDVLVVVSEYLASVARAIAGPSFWDDQPPPIRVIPNGIDTRAFGPRDSSSIHRRLRISADDRCLLFPHRPDPDKGFSTAVSALAELHRRGDHHKLLVPIHPARLASSSFYRRLRARADAAGVGAHLLLHDWIPLPEMPEYLSIGHACLSLSVVPEGNGLTPLEAIACGVPLVSTRAGGLRNLFPPRYGATYVGFRSPVEVADAVQARPTKVELRLGREHVLTNYTLERAVALHIDCFKAAHKRQSSYRPSAIVYRAIASPWCHPIDDTRVWHDYQMRAVRLRRQERTLLDTLRRQPNGISHKTLRAHGSVADRLLRLGIVTLVPSR